MQRDRKGGGEGKQGDKLWVRGYRRIAKGGRKRMRGRGGDRTGRDCGNFRGNVRLGYNASGIIGYAATQHDSW